jgi:hypothetical protein
MKYCGMQLAIMGSVTAQNADLIVPHIATHKIAIGKWAKPKTRKAIDNNLESSNNIDTRTYGPNEKKDAESMRSHGITRSLKKSWKFGHSQTSFCPHAVELITSNMYAVK